MGLDISVNATPNGVIESLEGGRTELDTAHIRRIANGAMDQRINTRPGSYSGIHRVRALYAKHRGWPLEEGGRYPTETEDSAKSHLCSHSDCDGWYLPDDFHDPIWTGDNVSIGSSVRLLSELREIENVPKDEYQQYSWDAVYLAALASVACRTPIKFH